MIFHQLVNEDSGCLSYLIGCGDAGQAIVVDPGRDRVNEYLRFARKKGLRIAHILETHTHADHISGNRDLAAATEAPIHVHQSAGVAFDHETCTTAPPCASQRRAPRGPHAGAHARFHLGVRDRPRARARAVVRADRRPAVRGLGRAPRPRRRRRGRGHLREPAACAAALDDLVEIYPAHGAGSSCGKAMSAKAGSTIGFERRFNPAFRYDDKRAFVSSSWPVSRPSRRRSTGSSPRTRGSSPWPRPSRARTRRGKAREAIAQGAFVLDLREVADFGEAHVPGALNVWIDGPQFAERVAGMAPAAPDPPDGGRPPTSSARSRRCRAWAWTTSSGSYNGAWSSGGARWLPVETVPQINRPRPGRVARAGA